MSQQVNSQLLKLMFLEQEKNVQDQGSEELWQGPNWFLYAVVSTIQKVAKEGQLVNWQQGHWGSKE